MPENDFASDLSNKAADAARQVRTSMGEAKATVADKATQIGNKAADSIDANRGTAANMLDSAASTLHEQSSTLPGGEKVAEFANETAQKLGATADYVRTHDSKEMMADVEAFVKSHPGQSLIAAGIIGFLAGRAFTNND